MKNFFYLFLLFLFTGISKTHAQSCTTLGQTPATAFPVCGTTVFHQGSVPKCVGTTVPSPCPGTLFTDKNPYWYKFTCFATGTLSFLITPIDINDDYDWQLFDVTGRNPSDVYSDPALFVACNWSGEGGLTGASAAGTSLIRCEGPGVPLFSSMPTLIAGRNYLLMVSHFTDSQVGYSLSFGGGTADITDPVPPHLLQADAGCDGTTITVKLNKKMKCKSLAADGSDFSINSPTNSIIAASATSCTSGFDMDSLTLTLRNPLAPGNYILSMVKGSDGNTLLDNCDRMIPENETLSVTVFPLIPTPMDSLKKPACAPKMLELVFRKPIKCSSIAADGSDFTVTGPYPVMVTTASGNCVNGLTSKIFIELSTALQVAGNFTLRLNRGTDGNTIFDDCSQETPAGSSLNFSVKDTVNADFSFTIQFGCEQNTVQYNHNGNNGVNSWNWNFDNIQSSGIRNPLMIYSNFEPKQTTLIVSNGVCADTSNRTLSFDNLLYARFEASKIVCPEDKAVFNNTTIGNIVNWQWEFGNGLTASVKNPQAQSYSIGPVSYDVLVRLTVTNTYGCKDTAEQAIRIINNCYIAVPSAFTPNGDGLNDFLYPLNAYKAKDLEFSVYNRVGQRVFYSNNWLQKWDGKFKGQGADPGTYVWILHYTDTDSNQPVRLKGTTVLIR